MTLIECIQDQGPYYRKLKAELESESNVNKELENTRTSRQKVEEQIDLQKAEISLLEEQSRKEYKDVRKMRHLSFRSAAATLSGKKKEKIEKDEAKYQIAFENEQRSKRKLEELQIQYDSFVSKEAELMSQTLHFKETRLQYESLITQIFQLEDPNFPKEPQLKAELRNYKEQKRLASRDKGRFIDAENALSVALVDIKKVIRLLDTVVNYVPFEIFGGPIIDDDQIAYLEAARRKIWGIQKSFNNVRTILPEIPYPQALDVVTNNALLNMQISANYIDIAWKAKTSQCFSILANAYRSTQNSLSWIKQYKQYAMDAVKRLVTVIEGAKEALQKERVRIMDTVLAGQVPSTANVTAHPNEFHHDHELPAFSATNYELPPPVYEAPALETQQQDNNMQSTNLPIIPSDFSSPIDSTADITLQDNDNSPPLLHNNNQSQLIIPFNNNTLQEDITSPSQSTTPIINNNTNNINQSQESVIQPITPNNNINIQEETYVSHNVNNPFLTHK